MVICWVGTACSSRVTTTPSSVTSGHAASSAAAMAAEAFPAPTTTHLPVGFSGSACANTWDGLALATAASNISRRKALARSADHPALFWSPLDAVTGTDTPSDIKTLPFRYFSFSRETEHSRCYDSRCPFLTREPNGDVKNHYKKAVSIFHLSVMVASTTCRLYGCRTAKR